MILKGKARKDFIEWCEKNYSLLIEGCGGFTEFWGGLPHVSEYALITEWLDSVKLHINTFCVQGKYLWNGTWEVTRCVKINHFPSRVKALKDAIENANELYNKQFELTN